MNQPPEFCPYCGDPVTAVDSPMVGTAETPMIYRCESCDDYVFYNPTPGGSAVVVDDGCMLLVEDFRDPGEWKLPSGRIELGESPREGVARELEEETGLSVDPDDLTYFYDEAGEPVEDMHMVGIDYAVARSKTTGPLNARSDATDAQFFTPGGVRRLGVRTETHARGPLRERPAMAAGGGPGCSRRVDGACSLARGRSRRPEPLRSKAGQVPAAGWRRLRGVRRPASS